LVEEPALLLDAMHEPSLACGEIQESYRVLWDHSFSSTGAYPPTTIRISRAAQGWTATAVKLSGSVHRGERERRVRALTARDIETMRDAIEAFQLWSRPDYVNHVGVDDGALWVVEGRRGTAYHAVMSAYDADTRAFRQLASVFARIAAINPGRMDPQP